MSRIIKTAKMLRRNWKKSTFFFGILAYGTSYVIEKYRTFEMMRAYCEEAKKYGEKPVPSSLKSKHVTVILNPEANYRKSNIQFEKFAAPLLHLAGFKVSVIQTEKSKQAEDLMQIMSNTDAVIVAGGDGTLQEAVTGLLRRPGVKEENLPLGIVPVGKTNTVAEYLFGPRSSSRAQLMAESVMAVIRETTINLDVLKIQFANEEKPIYAMVDFEEGVFGDIEPLVDKYWYLGFLKDRFTYFKNHSKESVPISNDRLEYVAPCSGCSRCYVPPKKKDVLPQARRWWHDFVSKKTSEISLPTSQVDESKATRINEECGKRIALSPSYSNISVSTAAADAERKMESGILRIKLFPADLTWKQFMAAGLSHRKSKIQDTSGLATVVEARQLIIEAEGFHREPAQIESVSSEPFATNPVENEPLQIVESESSSSSSSAAVGLSQVDTVALESPVQTESSPSRSSAAIAAASLGTNESEPSGVVSEEESPSSHHGDVYSYVDKEKHKRTSCIISLLPKQVTVYA